MASRSVSVPTSSGAATGAYAPQTVDTLKPLVVVAGLTIENTSTTLTLDVIVRDGGATGAIIAAAQAPVQVGAVPGIADITFRYARAALNGLYFEIDGGAVGTGSSVWIC